MKTKNNIEILHYFYIWLIKKEGIKSNMQKLKTQIKDNWEKLLFIILSITFSIPSISYIVKNKDILRFIGNWTWLGKIPTNNNEKILNAILFVFFISTMFLIYHYCIKNSKKFKNFKSIIILVTIISTAFSVVIPFTSLDVYSYIASRMDR